MIGSKSFETGNPRRVDGFGSGWATWKDEKRKVASCTFLCPVDALSVAHELHSFGIANVQSVGIVFCFEGSRVIGNPFVLII